MQWHKVSIYTTAAGIDPVCGRLLSLNVAGFEIEDKDDFNDFLENNHQYWDYVDDELMAEKQGETRVIIYISDNEEGAKLLMSVRDELTALKSMDAAGEYGRLELELESMREEDWEENWKQYFHPIPVGDRLIIKPEWETLENTEGKIVFNIDPGMTFGSGQHETTRLCVEQLDKRVQPGMEVLDLGCGSGILSIIALMLGAGRAYAIDIDPNCKKIAYSNAALNGIGKDVYTVEDGNILTDEGVKAKIEALGGHDIVVANIVADVIIPLSADARRYMKEGATFICCGIIEPRLGEVKEALKNNGFEIIEQKNENDWYCLVAR
ncbi:MAG: 50S ribosomal protein L11 methyltransferase [Oscillospiraceae bacterium]|nr:50S ribosomal protein L11 methyltransferase [Oscillospiraceae bacterium]